MTRSVTFAATQLAMGWDIDANLDKAESTVRAAHASGAQVILLQELFATPYFCKTQQYKYLDLAQPLAGNPMIERFSRLAAELQVVLPISYYERDTNTFFNSLVMIDADGTVLDNYRKTHIPDGPGYCEKFYFTPGDTGFKVWKTRYGTFGAGICWDQWFPETARCCALMGAEAMFYPTAIGSEPQDPSHWTPAVTGSGSCRATAAANILPVIASNRTGVEEDDGVSDHFLWLLVHHRPHRGQDRRGRPRRGKNPRGGASTWMPPHPIAAPGACSGTAAPGSTRPSPVRPAATTHEHGAAGYAARRWLSHAGRARATAGGADGLARAQG